MAPDVPDFITSAFVKPFNPDDALAQIASFLTGHRTLQGYAHFAETVRSLHNHIMEGGALPGRWQDAQDYSANTRKDDLP
jgi:hypothetical protein